MLPGFHGALWDFFQGVNLSVHWKDFAIETVLKMTDPMISGLTTLLGDLI